MLIHLHRVNFVFFFLGKQFLYYAFINTSIWARWLYTKDINVLIPSLSWNLKDLVISFMICYIRKILLPLNLFHSTKNTCTKLNFKNLIESKLLHYQNFINWLILFSCAIENHGYFYGAWMNTPGWRLGIATILAITDKQI